MPRVHESAKLHLTLRGVGLTNVSRGWFGGTSSPTFKISAFNPGSSEMWQTVVTSARIDQNLDPLWPSITVSCQELCGLDTDRPIQITVFDQDTNGADVGAMGCFETSVNSLLKKKIEDLNNVDVAKLFTLEIPGKPEPMGKIAVVDVKLEEPPKETLKRGVQNIKLMTKFGNLAGLAPTPPDDDKELDKGPRLELKLRGINLEPVSRGRLRGGSANPMYKILGFKMGDSDPFQVVFESETIDSELNPKWLQTSISMEELCSGNRDLPIMISVYDKATSKETLIGTCETSVADLVRRRVGDTDNVDASKIFKLKDNSGKEKGMLVAVEATVTEPTEVTPSKASNKEETTQKEEKRTSKSTSKEDDKKTSSKNRSPPKDDPGKSSEPSPSKSKPLDENSLLHLTLAGVDLVNQEGWLGTSDPFFQIEGQMKGFDGTTWQGIARSEHIEENLNPRWDPVTVNVDLLCQLDLDKPIRVRFYDFEEGGRHNPMGSFECTVNQLLKAVSEKKGDSFNLSKAFKPKSDTGEELGKIVVVAAQTETPDVTKSSRPKKLSVDQNSVLRITLEGVDMANVEGWMGCSDPMYQIETPMKDPTGGVIWQMVYRSEYIADTLNPRWKEAEISVNLLCQLDLDKPIRVKLYDWESSGQHNPMGHFETSLNRLLRSKAEKKGDKWDVSKAFIPKSDDDQEFGKIVVVDVSVKNHSPKRSRSGGKSTAPEVKVDKDSALVLTLAGIDMANVEGWFGMSDPMFFVEIPTNSADGTTRWESFYESEHIDDNLNPEWEPATLALEPLCQCDLDKPIRISFFDWEESGQHNPMGFFMTSVNRLLYSKAEKKGGQWDTAKALITRSEEGEEFGKIIVVDVRIDPKAGKEAIRAIAKKEKEQAKASRSPPRSPKKEPEPKAERSPVRERERSPVRERERSPVPERTKSPVPERTKSPVPERARSPVPEKQRSPIPERTRSPLPTKSPSRSATPGSSKSATPASSKSATPASSRSASPASSRSASPPPGREKELIADAGALLSLTLEGVGLANVEGWFGTSDPMFTLSTKREGSSEWETILTSQHIDDTLDPKWEPELVNLLDLCGGDLDRPVQLSVLDWEENGEHNPMGSAVLSVQDLLDGVHSGKKFTMIQAGEDYGNILVKDARIRYSDEKREVITDDGAMLSLTLEGVGLANVEGWFGTSDPMFTLSTKPEGSSEWETVLTSRHIDDTLDPKWEPELVNLLDLCNGDLDRPVRMSVLDWEESGEHNPMGSVIVSVQDLLDGVHSGKKFTMIQAGEDYGKILVKEARIRYSGDDSKRSRSDEGSLDRSASELSSAQSRSRSRSSGSADGSRGARSRSRSNSPGRYSDEGSRRSYDSGRSGSRRSYDSRDSRSYRSRGSRSLDDKSRGSRGSRSSFRSDYSGSKGGSFRSQDSPSRRRSSMSASTLSDYSPKRPEDGKSPNNSQRSFRSDRSRSLSDGSRGSQRSQGSLSRLSQGSGGSKRSRRSNDDSRRSYDDSRRSFDDSRRSYDSRRSNRSGSLSRRSNRSRYSDEGSYDSRRSVSNRSNDSRGSRSYDSRGSRSYSSRGSRSDRSRSFSGRSRSPSNRSRRSSWSGSRSRSPSYRSRGSSRSRSRSRSRSVDSQRSRSNRGRRVSDTGELKMSAWEELQRTADQEEEIKADLKFYLTLRGIKLSNVGGWFGKKSSPYFTISAHNFGTSDPWTPIYTSEALEGDLDPQWKPASMSLDHLCYGDLDKKIKVSVIDQNDKKKPAPMGSFVTTVNKLVAAKVGGFGSDDNFEESTTFALMEQGKEVGRMAVLSAHADAPKVKPVVLATETPKPLESSDRRYSDSSLGSRSRRSRRSYDSRSLSDSRYSSGGSRSRSLSRSRSSRGSSRRSYSTGSRYSDESSRRSWSRSADSRSRSADSRSSGSDSSESDSEVEVVEQDTNPYHEDATLHLTLCGTELANVDGFWDLSDPYVQIACYTGLPGPQMWQTIHRTEHIENTLEPRWKPMELNLDLLCKRDLDQPVQISVFDNEDSGAHQPMGNFKTTVNGLLEARVYFGEEDEIDKSKAFTLMLEGQNYGKVVVAGARIENPERLQAPIMTKTSADAEGDGTHHSRKKKKKGKKQKKQHQVKFNTHGDELSIGTIESSDEAKMQQMLEEPRNVFGEENNEDDGKSRPWKGALPQTISLDAFGGDDFQLGDDGENGENGSDQGSIGDIAALLARVEEAESSDSEEESDEEEEDSDEEDDQGGSDNDDDDDDDDDKEGSENQEDELEMMKQMEQSMSHMAATPNSPAANMEVDLEKFDEMYDQVIVDQKVVAEFERKLEERARRRNKNEDENEDPDLLRDTPRLILFESEKDSKKKKRGRKKKNGGSKFSKEFLDAMKHVFGDSDESSDESEAEEDRLEEKKEDEEAMMTNAGLNKRASESSLFVGDNADGKQDQDEDNDDHDDDDDDEMEQSKKSISSNVSKSMHSKHVSAPKKKPKRKKPKIDPAEVFAEEMRRQEGMKILSTSGLKQEMADMKKGLTRKMMERELANLRKATSNKFSPFDDKSKSSSSKPGLFDDYASTGKSYGQGSGAAADKKAKAKPSTGLGDHFSRNDAKNDDLADNRLDDLATVALGGGGNQQLPTLTNMNSLGPMVGGAKGKSTLGAISETGGPALRGAGEQTFFSTQNAWDDDESQANVGLTNSKGSGEPPGGRGGLGRGQSSRKFKAPQFNFGKKKGTALDDDFEDY